MQTGKDGREKFCNAPSPLELEKRVIIIIIKSYEQAAACRMS